MWRIAPRHVELVGHSRSDAMTIKKFGLTLGEQQLCDAVEVEMTPLVGPQTATVHAATVACMIAGDRYQLTCDFELWFGDILRIAKRFKLEGLLQA